MRFSAVTIFMNSCLGVQAQLYTFPHPLQFRRALLVPDRPVNQFAFHDHQVTWAAQQTGPLCSSAVPRTRWLHCMPADWERAQSS